jgi:hypothetical protein
MITPTNGSDVASVMRRRLGAKLQNSNLKFHLAAKSSALRTMDGSKSVGNTSGGLAGSLE